jgi:UPF0716 protein FxsA
MSLVKWTFIALIGLPAAEIVGFLVVAALIGWFWAGIAFIATSVLGVILLRRSGRRDLARLLHSLRNDGISALRLDSAAAATMLGTILLVLPGFITDVLGAALFVPALRRWAAAALAHAVRDSSARRGHAPRDHVIDLEPGEWHRVPDRSRPRRRKPARPKSKHEAKTRS